MAPSTALAARSSDLCTTPACLQIASEILGNMASNYSDLDPCTNFSQFSCGNWAPQHSLAEGYGGIEVLSAIHSEIYTTLKQILEGQYPEGSDTGWITVNLTDDQARADKENFDKLQSTYLTCLNYTAQEAEGLRPLAEFVNTVVQLFPVEESSDQAKHNHSSAMGNILVLFESLGIQTTQFITVDPNKFNRSENILTIHPIKPNPVPTEERLGYLQVVSALISAVHPNNMTEKKVHTLMEAAIALDDELVTAATLADAELLEREDVSMSSLSEIHKLAPQLNYEYVVSQLAPKGYEAEIIQDATLDYYQNASRFISETPADVLQIYFLWKAVSALSTYVESPLANAVSTFGQDPKSLDNRWKSCISFVDVGVDWFPDVTGLGSGAGSVGPTGLTWILSRFYAEKKYSSEANNQMVEIASYLEEAFIERVESVDWASSDVKKASAEKARVMDKRIALPTDPNAFDPIETRRYYANVNITQSHFENALALPASQVAKEWKSLGQPYRKGWYMISTLTTNAFYHPIWNAITMLLGFLQFPNYDVGFPSYIAYGGLGSVVGHEITHGFDTRGRLTDKDGNLTKWWDDKSIDAYNNKTQCFVEQYNNYTLTASNGTEVHLDGSYTLTENIADAGGLVSSFAAWKNWENAKGRAKNLPGLEKFTHEQLFFLKWGQTWCNDIPTDKWISLFGTDQHSPHEARINVALKNSKEFLKAFKCPTKEPVCELW